MDPKRAGETLSEIVRDLLSYDENRYKHALETYFVEDAKLTHPLLNVEGTHNIRKVFRVWTSLNCREPEPNGAPIYNGETAVIQVFQHLSPTVLPFINIKIPAVTILRFRECDDGLLYIYRQEDNWTLEGLIKSVPLINWWYDYVVRVVVGDLMTRAGSFLATANRATSHLACRANEIKDNSQSAIAQGQYKAQEYLGPPLNSLYTKSQDVVDQAKNAIWSAQAGVKHQISKVYSNGNGNIHPSPPEMAAH